MSHCRRPRAGLGAGRLLAERQARDRTSHVGAGSACPTAVAGAAAWAETSGSQRWVGAVHALGTDIATLLSLGSLVARLRGRYGAATRSGREANLAMMGAGFLGGHLALNRGTARRSP